MTENLPANINVRHDDAALPPERRAKSLNAFGNPIDELLIGAEDTWAQCTMENEWVHDADGGVDLGEWR